MFNLIKKKLLIQIFSRLYTKININVKKNHSKLFLSLKLNEFFKWIENFLSYTTKYKIFNFKLFFHSKKSRKSSRSRSRSRKRSTSRRRKRSRSRRRSRSNSRKRKRSRSRRRSRSGSRRRRRSTSRRRRSTSRRRKRSTSRRRKRSRSRERKRSRSRDRKSRFDFWKVLFNILINS